MFVAVGWLAQRGVRAMNFTHGNQQAPTLNLDTISAGWPVP